MRATAWKDNDGQYIVEKDGERCVLSNSMAHAVFELIQKEHRYMSFYEDVSNRMEAQGIDVEKNMPMLEYICNNLADEIWQDEMFWELEDKNIDYMIDQYQKGEAMI